MNHGRDCAPSAMRASIVLLPARQAAHDAVIVEAEDAGDRVADLGRAA